ncbi:MAG: hypothetical protein ACLFVX_11300 [Archaeoglobaceae archaeon]
MPALLWMRSLSHYCWGDNITIPSCTAVLVDAFKRYRSSVIAVERLAEERIP